MDNTPDSPAKTPVGYTTQGGNYWTLITPEIWKVLHAVLHQAGLTTIYEELWMRAADIVKADHEMVEGLGRRVVSLATELGEPVGLSEAQLESLPAIKKRFGCAD